MLEVDCNIKKKILELEVYVGGSHYNNGTGQLVPIVNYKNENFQINDPNVIGIVLKCKIIYLII